MTSADEVAGRLRAARTTGTLTSPPSQVRAFSMEEGYEVAARLHRDRLAAGAKTAGAKLGFTNRAIWPMFGLNEPFWAPIYDDTVTSDRVVSLQGLVAPRIEPEIVLGFEDDLAAGASAEEVEDALEWAALGFEIVRCHYPDWVMAPADAVADAGLHGRLVVGERVAVRAGVAAALSSTALQLHRNGEPVDRGSGADALGGPVDAVVWLLRLPGVDGLRAGSMVTTGTLTKAWPIAGGEVWRSESDGSAGLGALEITFD